MAASSCAPKEAEDPADILAEDPGFLHQEGGGLHEGQGPPDRDAELATGSADRAPDPPATREQCRFAARHIEELGIELAIASERDPERRRSLQREKAHLLESEAVKKRIRQTADECLARGTTQSEALCIAEIQSDAEIERCASP